MSEKIKPIRTGLCAFGMSGKVFHAPFLSCLPMFELGAVVERHQKNAASLYPGVISYDDVDALLADNSLELVVVNTPNTTHYDYVKKALQASKHVIVEKPFTATVAQAEELIKLAEEKNRFLIVFQNRRWDSDFRTVQEVIKKGLLGDLIETEIHYDRYRAELSSVKPHKEKPAPAVGNIYDLGPHLIDQAIVLFGKPEAVFALVQTHRGNSLVDDYFDIKLLYEGFTCTLKSSLLVAEPLAAYILHGTKGSFIKSRTDVQEEMLQSGVMPCIPGWGQEKAGDEGLIHTVDGSEDTREKYPTLSGCYQKFFEGVYASIREQKPALVPLEDSLLNMQIVEAALQSSRERKIVEMG